jgi:hypothetical protein
MSHRLTFIQKFLILFIGKYCRSTSIPVGYFILVVSNRDWLIRLYLLDLDVG